LRARAFYAAVDVWTGLKTRSIPFPRSGRSLFWFVDYTRRQLGTRKNLTARAPRTPRHARVRSRSAEPAFVPAFAASQRERRSRRVSSVETLHEPRSLVAAAISDPLGVNNAR